MEIRHLQHHEIDYQKWDKCIKKSVNGSIYAFTWYLNIVCEDWDALVDEKYETVMPLTYTKILGVRCLVQPIFTSNLGLFSTQVLNRETVDAYFKAIPKNYILFNINLNKYNKISNEHYKIKKDCVYEIDLIPSYERITASYTPEIKDILEHNSKNKITVVTGMNSNDLISLYLHRKNIIKKLLYRKHINKIKMIVSNAVKYRVGQVFGAYTRENNLCAAAFYIWSHNRVFLLFLGFNEPGINNRAYVTLIDEFIKLHAEQNITLRFEYASGKTFSEIYLGFGGRKYEFTHVRQKWFSKLFKTIKR